MIIRDFQPEDLDAIVELSLLAWEPVFTEWERLLGAELYPIAISEDWQTMQAETVRTYTTKEGIHALVADVDGVVAGFITYELVEDQKTGEVMLLAVHPDYQNAGIGTALNEFVLDKFREAGMKLAVVGTGGDEGHAPARRSYEKAGYVGLPTMRYYQLL